MLAVDSRPQLSSAMSLFRLGKFRHAARAVAGLEVVAGLVRRPAAPKLAAVAGRILPSGCVMHRQLPRLCGRVGGDRRLKQQSFAGVLISAEAGFQ